MAIHTIYGEKHGRYLKLIRRFPLRPLRSDAELDDAVQIIDELLDRPALVEAEQDYLDVLSDLVERYEQETHPLSPVADADLLQHLLEARGIKQSELAKGAGISESTVSEILSGKRKINRRHIEKLARFFHVDASVFFADG